MVNQSQNNENYIHTLNETDSAILLMNQDMIDNIIFKSGELAKGNEFQVHYFAVVRQEMYNDLSSIYFIIPYLFYNYPQQVNSASIDFELKDVNSKKAELQEKALEKGQTIVSALNKISQFTKEKPIKIQYQITQSNNIHRHP